MRANRFREVCEHFATLIDEGKMEPGDKLPTVLQISQLWGISYATAKKSVETLRDQLYVRTDTRGAYVYLGGNERLYQQLRNVLNALEAEGQAIQVEVGNGTPCVMGLDGGACWDPETGSWIQPTA